MSLFNETLDLASDGRAKIIAGKIDRIDHALGGVSRIFLQMAVGPIDRENRLGSIERLAEIARYIDG